MKNNDSRISVRLLVGYLGRWYYPLINRKNNVYIERMMSLGGLMLIFEVPVNMQKEDGYISLKLSIGV